MSTGDIYELWKKARSSDDLADSFVDEVMTDVRRLERRRRSGPSGIVESLRGLMGHRGARVGFVAGGAAAGVVRLGWFVFTLLGC